MIWSLGGPPSIERRLPLLALATLALVVGVMLAASYVKVRTLTRMVADERLERVTTQLSAILATPMAERSGRVGSAAARPLVRQYLEGPVAGSPAVARTALRELVADRGGDAPVVAALWGPDGRLLMAEPDSLADRWPLRAPVAGTRAGVSGFHAPNDTSLYFDIVAPVLSGERTLGHLVEHRVVATNPQSLAATRGLIGDESILMLGGGPTGVWTDLVRRIPPPPVAATDTAGLLALEADGRAYLSRTEPVAGTPWLVVVGLPRDVVFAPEHAFLRVMLPTALGLLLLAGWATWLASRRLARPIRRIADAADAVAAGEYDRRVRVERRDEIGRLADAFNDMTGHVAEHVRALKVSEARFRSLVTASAQMIWRTDAEGNVRGLLPDWQRYTGQREAETQGAGWSAAVHPDDVPRVLRVWREAVSARRSYEIDYRIRRYDGAYRWFTVRGAPVLDEHGRVREWIGACTDITEQRAAAQQLRRKDEELRQAQKMEAIGRLAGGVAHDFNNLLTAILGPADLALQALPADHAARAELEEIRGAAIRATEVTHQLLAFSRQQVIAAEPLDLNDIVDAASRFLKRVIGEEIDLDRSLAPDLGTIRADRTQLEQIIMNLAVNARDAMPRGGKLTLETANVDVDPAYAAAHPALRPGPHVLLAVTDTGAGMDAETRARLFEPFFTTKERGKGTGLGLATVYGIVQQSGGHIVVYTEPGAGTTFKVFFPRVDERAVRQPRATERDLQAYRGSETVLVAEDEAAVRQVTERILKGLGYEVLTAPDGEAALRLVAERDGQVDLVVADVVMPGMSGGALARQLRDERPELSVLFLSGYAGDAIVRHGVLTKGTPFLQKPFTPEALARKVREVLDAPARSA